MTRILRFVLLGGAALWSLTVGAESGDDYCKDNPDDCIAVGQWQFSLGVGLGMRTNPLVDGDDIPIVLLPEVSYYGQRFFFDTTSLGFTVLETRRQTVNVLATVGLDNMYFNDVSLGNFVIEGTGGGFNAGGLVTSGAAPEHSDSVDSAPAEDQTRTPNTTDPDGPQEFFHKPQLRTSPDNAGDTVALDAIGERKLAGLAGLEYSVYLGRTMFSAQWLTDFTGVHDGREVRLGLDHRVRVGPNRFALATGAVWQSEEVVNYYYGLDSADVGEITRLHYRGEAAITPFVRLDWVRPLGRGWHLQTTVHHKWLGGEIADSPLLAKDHSTTVFVGGVYHF